MKKYNYKINSDSLFISGLINFIYILPVLIFLLIVNILNINITVKTQLIVSMVYILLSEIMHRFILSKWCFVKFAYNLKDKIEKCLNENMYFIINNIFSFLNIVFICYSIIYFSFFNHLYKDNISGIFEIVPNIITIASIILALILALLQYFSNKFPDFISLLTKWKKDTIVLFGILVIYSLISFSAIYFKDFINIDLWIYVTSILLVIQLCLIGCEALLLMNDKSIINLKNFYILNLIKNMPNISTTDDGLKNINNILNPNLRTKIKNFWIYYCLGIVNDKIYDASEYFTTYIRQEIDALFRTANIYIEKDNLILFKINLYAINQIIQNIIIKTKGVEHFNIYEYFAAKQKLLFDNIVKFEREEYLLEMTNLNLNTIKSLIKVSDFKYNKLSCSATISFLIEQLEYIILNTASFKHTTATTSTIGALREISQYLLDKNDEHITIVIIKTLENIALNIDKFYESRKINIDKIWVATIIGQTIYAQVNIMFYVVINSFEKEKCSYDYLLKQSKKSYIKTFILLSKYCLLNSHPANSLYSPPNTNYEMLYNCVVKNMEIKTPYRNLVLKGVISHITTVSCISEIFGHVFISDLDNDKLFNIAILNLIRVLEILNDIPYETMNNIALDNLTDFYKNIINSTFVFIERINKFNFNVEYYSVIINDFLVKLLDMSFINFSMFYKNPNINFINGYIYFLTKFLYQNNIINGENVTIEQTIYEIIEKIIKLFKVVKNFETKRELFSNLKLLNIQLFEFSKESKIFNLLFDFVIENQENFKTHYNNFYTIWETEGLPYESKYQINEDIVKKYIQFRNTKTA